MKIIIPMAGTGQRFVDAGYDTPKPFIIVDGKPIIEHIVNMFDRENDEFIFICNDKTNSHHWHILRELVSDFKLRTARVNSFGPVYSFIHSGAMDCVGDDEEVIVSYCDNPFLFDYLRFKEIVSQTKPDGVIFSHTGFHPHRLSSTYMAYMKTSPKDAILPNVLEIKEKEPYTDNHWQEHASTGTYYFRKGSYIKKYFQELLDKKLCHSNGEYYVTLVYNLMIAAGLTVHAYPSSYVSVFGTPAELENYNAWQAILRGDQVKDADDLLQCYNYWKEYNRKKSLQNEKK